MLQGLLVERRFRKDERWFEPSCYGDDTRLHHGDGVTKGFGKTKDGFEACYGDDLLT